MRIYLAGRITGPDSRWRVDPDKRNCGRCLDSVTADEYISGSITHIPVGGRVYVGPFSVSCDHHCFHKYSGHASLKDTTTYGATCTTEFDTPSPGLVVDRCMSQISACDVMLVRLDAMDLHGTASEVGVGVVAGKIVVMDVPVGLRSEFWFLINQTKSQSKPTQAALDAVKPWMRYAPTTIEEYRYYYKGVSECR